MIKSEESLIEKSINEINRSYFMFKLSNKGMNDNGRRHNQVNDTVIDLLDQHHLLIQRIENMMMRNPTNQSSRRRVHSTTTHVIQGNMKGYVESNVKYGIASNSKSSNVNRTNSLFLKKKFIDVNKDYSFGNKSHQEEDNKKDEAMSSTNGTSTTTTSSHYDGINRVQSHMEVNILGKYQRYQHMPLTKAYQSQRRWSPKCNNDAISTYQSQSQHKFAKFLSRNCTTYVSQFHNRNTMPKADHSKTKTKTKTNKKTNNNNSIIIITKPKSPYTLQDNKPIYKKPLAYPHEHEVLTYKKRLFSK